MASMIGKFGELLKQREINRVAYFHTDHFEPWRSSDRLAGVDLARRNMDDLVLYGERMVRLDHGRRLTLFYLPPLELTVDPTRNAARVPGDDLGIIVRPPEQDAIIRPAFDAFGKICTPEIQVHYHHEFLTWNRKYCRQVFPDQFGAEPCELDRLRFDIGLAETLRYIRLDTGAPLTRWFFVHGMWALNASDMDVCCITDEVARLHAHGGLGDFSFPAGRAHCDPSYDRPMLVLPVEGAKAYDTSEADPLPPGAIDDAARRFLIWSSRVATSDASLDFFAPHIAANLASYDDWAVRLLSNSVQADGTLYLKTHAHSCNDFYFASQPNAPNGLFPHEHSAVVRLLGELGEAIGAIGGCLDMVTASQVYDELIQLKPADKPGFGYLGLPSPFSRETIRRADTVGVAVLADRLERLGENESGLYGHYAALVARGSVIQPLDLALLDAVERFIPLDAPITNVFSAVGILGASLALDGRRVTAVEGMRTRFDAQTELRDTLSGAVETARGEWKVFPHFYRGDWDLSGQAVIAANATFTMSDEDYEAAIAGLARARCVIIDMLRFIRRLDNASIAETLECFARAGLGEGRRITDLKEAGQLYLFTPPGGGGSPQELSTEHLTSNGVVRKFIDVLRSFRPFRRKL